MLAFQFSLFGKTGVDPTTLTPQSALELALRGIEIALAIIGAVVVVYILMAGIVYATSGGDAKKQGDAKKTIQAALIGLMIVVGAFTITNTVLQRLKFKDTILQGSGSPLQPYIK